MIRLVLADDHDLVLDGLRAALQHYDDLELAGSAGDGLAAIRLIRELRPHVAVLDLHMPKRSGLDVARALQHEALPTRTLIVTSFDDDETYRAALAAGVSGFMGKAAGVERLVSAIRAVARGETFYESGVSERARKAMPEITAPRAGRDNPLTPREREVLRSIATGLNNQEIADQLSMRVGTVKNHTSSILSKLGVRDRTRAALVGLRDGWI